MPTKYFCAERLYKKRALFDVDIQLQLCEREMIAILGHSGSGKSTVLRLIAGIEKCDADCVIELNGTRISDLPPALRNVGMVFQSPALFMHKNVVDNVAYGLIARGEGRKVARQKAENFLHQFELGSLGKSFPSHLSGGEAQRVSLARSLIVQPSLMLFDEPLSALDAPLRKRLLEDILQMQKTFGWAGIWVTHDRSEAELVAQKIITMEKGHIIKMEVL